MEAIIDEEGEGTSTYFCEIVYENITQELIYNGLCKLRLYRR